MGICENAVISGGIVMRMYSLAAAATRGVGDAVAGADLNTRLGVGGGLRAHALLDLPGHGQESLLDVGSVLGRGLEERDAEAVSKLLRNGVLDDLLVRHIALVAYKQLVDTLGGVSVDLLQPLLDVVEAVHVGDIVDHTDAVSTSVVRRSNSSESFLASRVPNLQLHRLAIQLNSSDFEVDTDSRNVGFGVGVIGESQEKTRLSNTGITDEEKLEEVVVFGIHLDCYVNALQPGIGLST